MILEGTSTSSVTNAWRISTPFALRALLKQERMHTGSGISVLDSTGKDSGKDF